MPFGYVRHPCHTPYICRGINDFESQPGPFRVHLSPFQPFLRGVFVTVRNIPFTGWLVSTAVKNEVRIRPNRSAPACVKPKENRNGIVHKRHQDHGRPFRASVAGYLLCREAARESAAEDGGKSHRQAAETGLFDPSG